MPATESNVVTVVTVGADNTITLSSDITQAFQPDDRFLVTIQGDTVILKRISTVNVLDRVEATPDDEPPPTMDEINAIVHEVRQQQKQGSSE